MAKATCTVDGCTAVAYAQGFCGSHARKMWLYGDPLGGRPSFDSVDERFWAKVDKRDPKQCWEWTGAIANGYGRFGITTAGRTVAVTASRLAWELTNGPIPKTMWVLHRCDNKSCVNPAHLYLGDRADNTDDAVTRGRIKKGSGHHGAKLTEEQVLEIKRRFSAGGVGQAVLAREFGISKVAMLDVLRGRTWAHASPKGWTPHVPRTYEPRQKRA